MHNHVIYCAIAVQVTTHDMTGSVSVINCLSASLLLSVLICISYFKFCCYECRFSVSYTFFLRGSVLTFSGDLLTFTRPCQFADADFPWQFSWQFADIFNLLTFSTWQFADIFSLLTFSLAVLVTFGDTDDILRPWQYADIFSVAVC